MIAKFLYLILLAPLVIIISACHLTVSIFRLLGFIASLILVNLKYHAYKKELDQNMLEIKKKFISR